MCKISMPSTITRLYHNTCILIQNPDLINLELELVESVASGETPRSLEVFAQVVDLLDGGDERVIDGLRVRFALFCHYACHSENDMVCSTHLLLRLLVFWDLNLLLSLSEELSLLAGLDTLGLGEESVVDGLGNGNRGDVDLGRGGDNVGLVNSSEGNTVEPDPLVNVPHLHSKAPT
jgi:hypothetical protein